MPKKNRISRAELLRELEEKLERSDAPKLNKDLERLSLQSAVFLVGDPKRPAESDMLDREQAEKLAGQIMRKSDPNYMEWNYGNLHDTAAEKHFEGMLLQSIDSLTLPPEVDRAGKKEELRSRIPAFQHLLRSPLRGVPQLRRRLMETLQAFPFFLFFCGQRALLGPITALMLSIKASSSFSSPSWAIVPGQLGGKLLSVSRFLEREWHDRFLLIRRLLRAL